MQIPSSVKKTCNNKRAPKTGKLFFWKAIESFDIHIIAKK